MININTNQINISNYSQYLELVQSNLSDLLVSQQIVHTEYGSGTITKVDHINLYPTTGIFVRDPEICCELQFGELIKKWVINIGLNSCTLSIDPNIQQTIDEYLIVLGIISYYKELDEEEQRQVRIKERKKLEEQEELRLKEEKKQLKQKK